MNEIKIMEDKGPWVFTEEQIKNIKNFSAEDISKFYNDNYDIILSMAKKFIKKQNSMGRYNYDIQDLIHQVFVDLPHYTYKTRFSLHASIVKGTFKYINYGGMKAKRSVIQEYQLASLSIGDENDNDLLLDYIESYEEKAFDFENPIEDREEKDKKIIEYLEKTFINPKQLNAMFCKLFTDIPEAEIRGDEYERYRTCKMSIK